MTSETDRKNAKIAKDVLNSYRTVIARDLKIPPDGCSFVETLVSQGCLTEFEQDLIYSRTINQARISELIDCVRRRMSMEVFTAFLNALGSVNVANLPNLRNDIQRAYVTKGGDGSIFEDTCQPQPQRECSLPSSRSRTITDAEVLSRDCGDRVHDVLVFETIERVSIVLLLEHNRCVRILWDQAGGQARNLENASCSLRRVDTARQLISIKGEQYLLAWPARLALVSLTFANAEPYSVDASMDLESGTTVTCATALVDTAVVGTAAGTVLCMPLPFSRIQQSSDPLFVGAVPVHGLLKLGHRQLLAWSQTGQVVCGQVSDSYRFETSERWTVPLRCEDSVLQALAADGDCVVAVVLTRSRQVSVMTFEKTTVRMHVDIGAAPNGLVHVAAEKGECAVATAAELVIIRQHRLVRRLRLPWANAGLKHLRVEIQRPKLFLLIATESSQVKILPIDENNY